ncbi:acyl carrier protein [Caproiciproducens galactitolivorans]|uniref:Acyl carrier protein n=1 Tax=Caproiciproducens galactitolivorans TaxID=642589 RepID=A0ABT4BT36_9FIRM|nr:acyl carrier protein [Caproiciproducens galactitolivorans]MCY1714050.1 acyl carrier protein [Caproiciproducens galactitolivorans]
MEEIIKILKQFRPDIDFENQKNLIGDGLLDSLDIVSIVSEFDSEFDIEIPVEEITPENFNSVQAMKELIERLKDEA